MKKGFHIFLALLLLLSVIPSTSVAADMDYNDEVYSATLADGTAIFSAAHTLFEGDEYISTDNKLYRVASISGSTATVEAVGDEEMPDISWLSTDATLPVYAAQDSKKLICIYATHSDESYVPTDGTQSIKARGGIYDVAESLKTALESNGVEVIVDETQHHPHDAGAYRRSRQTATTLAKKMPDALIDIHRDGIPNPNEYTTTINGENASKVRLLVGKSNQNSAANRDFAKQIKAVGDKLYPGLIKDIFIGKGNYNQELMPHAILLEFGTHTISKERVIESTKLMADVLTKSLYGSVSGSAAGGTSDGKASSSGTTTTKGTTTQGSTAGTSTSKGAGTNAQSQNTATQNKTSSDSSAGASSGIIWMVVIGLVALCVFAFLATGSGRGMKEKLARNTSEMTGGLLGKKHEPDHRDDK